MLGQNHFVEPNWPVLTFVHPEFAVKCTGGVALNTRDQDIVNNHFVVQNSQRMD
jgi:hypothetical protein